MFIEFNDELINVSCILSIWHYVSDSPDAKKPYKLMIEFTKGDWEVSEQFVTQHELDARFLELKKILCADKG